MNRVTIVLPAGFAPLPHDIPRGELALLRFARHLSSWERLPLRRPNLYLSPCISHLFVAVPPAVPVCLSLPLSRSLCRLFDSDRFVHLFSLPLSLALSQPLCRPGFAVSFLEPVCRLGCVLAAAEDGMTFKRAVWAATAASVGLNVTSAY